MILNGSLFVAGLLILILSSDWLIQSSVKLAGFFKVTTLFIGLVLVAFGTSAPEAGVGIMAVLRGQMRIALGNIVGSNIANIGLILGICAMFKPLKVDKSIFKREMPIMMGVFFLFYILSRDLCLSRLDGAVFICCFIGFCFFSYKNAKKNFNEEEINSFKLKKQLVTVNSCFKTCLIVLISLAGVVLGADLMVKGGVELARIFNVSPWIIGITVFAVGTSLPELAASLTASLKEAHNISVGNIVGSNIFNILFVLGVAALIKPLEIAPSMLRFEFPVMIIFGFLLFTVMKTKYKISRGEGAAVFLGYLIFLYFLFIRNRGG